MEDVNILNFSGFSGRDAVESATNSHRVSQHICSVEEYIAMCDAPRNKQLYEAIDAGDSSKKKYLNAVMWCANVPDGMDRALENCYPSGFNFLDFDGKLAEGKYVDQLFEELLALHKDKQIGLRLFQDSISPESCHVVIDCVDGWGDTLEEQQHYVCDTLLDGRYTKWLDPAVHTFASLAFVSPSKNIRFISKKLFE